MLEFLDLKSYPWIVAVILADLALITATIRLVLRSDHRKWRWLWLLLAVIWPILVIIIVSPKFQRKWLWTAFSLIAPSLSFGVAQTKRLFLTSIPIDMTLSGSVSIAAVIIVGWWLWGPVETGRVPS